MRAIRPINRGKSLWSTVLLGLAAILVGGVGTVAVLGATKVIDLQRLAFWRKTPTIPADWIAIPLCAKSVPAYAAVTREHLLNPMTGQWLMDHQPPEKARALVQKGVITDIDKIRGRVAAREHGAMFYFSENDFLPPGTRPGVVGGTPAGKRAITLDASKLKGVHDLKAEDHLDLLASVAVDMPGAGRSGGRLGTNVVVPPDNAFLPKRSIVRPLVQDGVVVAPVRVRTTPPTSPQGGSAQTTSVQEIVIGVEPQEVAPLAEAMDLKYEITCVARSGRASSAPASSAKNPSSGGLPHVLGDAVPTEGLPGGSGKPKPAPDGAETAPPKKTAATGGGQGPGDITPGFDPLAHTRYTEVMIGAQRQYVVFAGPGGGPVVALQEGGSAKADSEVRPASASEEGKQ